MNKILFFCAVLAVINHSSLGEIEGPTLYDAKTFEFELNDGQQVQHNHEYHRADVNPDSIRAVVVVSGDMIGSVIGYNSNLFNVPSGSGDDVLYKYARALWIFYYLKSSQKLTADRENVAKDKLKEGFQNMMKYKNSDGGFSNTRGGQSSTFLTAYFAYVFGSAMQSGIEPINKEVIKNALQFCVNKKNSYGSFNEVGYSKILSPSEETTPSRKTRFTAFVLLALIKNRNYIEHNFESAIDKGKQFLEEQLSFDNYAAAVVANAIDGNIMHDILQTLSRKSETDGESTHWNAEKGRESSKNIQFLISSYVAIAYIKSNQIDKAKPIIRWLIKQENSKGEFSDSFASAVTFEAFAMMAEKTGASNTQIHFEFYGNFNEKFEYDLTDSNALKSHTIEMPKGTKDITIKAQGKGYGMVQTFFDYTKIINEQSKTFELVAASLRYPNDYNKIHVCVKKISRQPWDDMDVMELKLANGFVYDAEKSDPMRQNSNIQNIEVLRGGTFVNFYQELPINEEICINVYAKKAYEVQSGQKASVGVYNYANRDQTFSVASFNMS